MIIIRQHCTEAVFKEGHFTAVPHHGGEGELVGGVVGTYIVTGSPPPPSHSPSRIKDTERAEESLATC